jgi:hypothetical protein
MDRKSQIKSQILVAAILTLAIAGCAAEDTQKATTPPPTATPVAKSPPAVQSFNNPVVSGKKAVTVASGSANLIQLTNATERVVVVSKGRNDPFAQIVGQTVLEMSQTTAKQVPVLPPLPAVSTKGTVTATITKTPFTQTKVAMATKRPLKVNAGLIAVLPKVLPQIVPNPTLASVLPPSVQPDLAKAVIVTGVVLLGKQPQAIIKVPNELTSRYVQAGQRLANGILIKRIEMNEGSNPIVILEQYGIEVARMVGDAPVGSTPATKAGEKPVSVTTPPQNPLSVGAS